jgi:hypothetical protein
MWLQTQILTCLGWERQKSATTRLRAGWTYQVAVRAFSVLFTSKHDMFGSEPCAPARWTYPAASCGVNYPTRPGRS